MIYSLGLCSRASLIFKNQLDWIQIIAKQAPVVDCLWGPLIITDHRWIEEALIKNTSLFIKSQTYYELMRNMLGEGLLTTDGDAWKTSRQFHQPNFSQNALNQAEDRLYYMIQQNMDTIVSNRPIALDQYLNQSVTQLFYTLLTGSNDVTHTSELVQLIQICNEETSRISPFLRPIKQRPRCKKALSRLHLILLDAVNSSQSQGLLYPLINAYEQKKISHHNYLSEMKNFFVAGAETTATSLQWLIALLLKNPETLRLVTHQVRANKTELLKQSIQEALRLYPPIWCMLRRCTKDVRIQNHTINANKSIIISPYALHRSEYYWEEPHSFQPQRFSREIAKNRPKNCYIPFGLGPRVCIGKHLAMLVMEHTMEALLNHYDLSLGTSNLSMEPKAYVTLQRAHPLVVQLQRAKPHQ